MKRNHSKTFFQSMKIAFCRPEFTAPLRALSDKKVSASNIQQEYIAESLCYRGHKLTFVGPRSLSEIAFMTDAQEPQIVPLTWSGSSWFNLISRGSWLVQRALGIPYLNFFSNLRFFDAYLQCLPGHDLVYERNSLYRAGVAMACKWLSLPYVLFFDADEIMEYDFMDKPIRGLLRWRAKQLIHYNLKVAKCVVCVSEQAKKHLTTIWKVPAEKIVVFPNGVDVTRFQPSQKERAYTRDSLGFGENPLIVFVGNFYEWHDVTTLLDSFATALIAYPDARLLLVGDGSQRDAMMKHAFDIGIGNAVVFTGSVSHDEIPRIVSAADIAVAPYPAVKQDLWLSPMKLFEYMACGNAIIASEVGQLAEIIEDDKNGLLVPPGDSLAMANALKKLISDKTLSARLGQQAREDAVGLHSWENYISRLEIVLKAVAANRPIPNLNH
jgi:glycosyltransferase involved in cell wall biosynthesis